MLLTALWCRAITLWSRDVLEKLISPQLIKKSPAFMEPGDTLLYSKGPTTHPHPEPKNMSNSEAVYYITYNMKFLQ
jgi:hypothetical protein